MRREQLRALLDQPRTRADLAHEMGLSPSRITELLEPLAQAGEVLEEPDPEQPTRKRWLLARPDRDEPMNGGLGESDAVPPYEG